MKQITQERLLRIIDRIDTVSAGNIQMNRQTEIINALSLRGLKSAFGCDTQLDNELLRLELNYWEFPKTRKNLHSLCNDWRTKIFHYHAKREKVWSIQERYQVSGLTWYPSDFDPSFSVPWVNESLNLIDYDLEVLSKCKPLHLQRWVDHLRLQNCSFYRWVKQDKQNEWKPLSVTDLFSVSPYYQWCHTWNHAGIFHLLLGNGKDTDSTESDTAWFCATQPNVKPYY